MSDCVYPYGPVDAPVGCLSERDEVNDRLIPAFKASEKNIDWATMGAVNEIRDQ